MKLKDISFIFTIMVIVCFGGKITKLRIRRCDLALLSNCCAHSPSSPSIFGPKSTALAGQTLHLTSNLAPCFQFLIFQPVSPSTAGKIYPKTKSYHPNTLAFSCSPQTSVCGVLSDSDEGSSDPW